MSLHCPPEIQARIRRYQSGTPSVVDNLLPEVVVPLFAALDWTLPPPGSAEADSNVTALPALSAQGPARPMSYSLWVGQREVIRLSVVTKRDTPPIEPPGPLPDVYSPLLVVADHEQLTLHGCPGGPTNGFDSIRIPYAQCHSQWPQLHGWLSRAQCVERNKVEPHGHQDTVQGLLHAAEQWGQDLARDLQAHRPTLDLATCQNAARRTIDRILYLRLCEARHIEPLGTLRSATDPVDSNRNLTAIFKQGEQNHGAELFGLEAAHNQSHLPEQWLLQAPIKETVHQVIEQMYTPAISATFNCLPDDVLGQRYEQLLYESSPHDTASRKGPTTRRRGAGVFYTPRHIVDHVVQRSLGPLTEGKHPDELAALRVLDPACGSGAFLIAAYQHLLDAYLQGYLRHQPEQWLQADRAPLVAVPGGSGHLQLSIAERIRILNQHMFGVDVDAQAVQITRLSLALVACRSSLEAHPDAPETPAVAMQGTVHHIRQGNALLDTKEAFEPEDTSLVQPGGPLHPVDWANWFPSTATDGFDVLVGNPPWGQKGIDRYPGLQAHLQARYPSARGIYDLFRPFVEQALRLLGDNGRFGMVLPDIVLLKNYPQTRRFLLDHLEMTDIDWWPKPFLDATIDAVTITGRKSAPAADHCIRVQVHRDQQRLSHTVPQAAFERTDRLVFNLGLTPQVLTLLDRVAACPRGRDFLEAHEGVHTGNMRSALLVPEANDDTCRPILVGKGEMNRYHLRWDGTFVRLGLTKHKGQTFSLGQPEWYAQDKLLIRRTGDYIMAAVDRSGRYASNNMFIAFPRADCGLSIDGLCALLNSPFMTWYFRAIHPRTGRAFAELKIHHLMDFPLPPPDTDPRVLARLDELGHTRSEQTAAALQENHTTDPSTLPTIQRIDAQIAQCVADLFGYTESERQLFCTPTPRRRRRRSAQA